jgi:ELWxxDGT repeat protein
MKLNQSLIAIALSIAISLSSLAPALAGTTWSFAPGNNGSNITESVTIGSTMYFVADDGSGLSGQLWKTDGSTAGTVKLGGQAGLLNASSLTVVNGRIVFAANDADHGRELWGASDASNNSVVMYADLNPGPASSDPGLLTQFGSSGTADLAFSADRGSGQELLIWRKDDPAPVAPQGFGSNSAVKNPTAIAYSVTGDPSSTRLFVSGTYESDAINSLVKISRGATGDAQPTYYILGRQIDVQGLAPNKSLLGRVYFSAVDSQGREPWYSDGNSNGAAEESTKPTTKRIGDINPGSGSSDPAEFAVLATGNVVFSANPGSDPRRLYRGTSTSSTQVSSIAENPSNLFVDGTDLYFSAGTPATGVEAWVATSNATVIGSAPLDINPGSASSYPYGFKRLGSYVNFGAQRANGVYASGASMNVGFELFSIANGGLFIGPDINPGPDPSLPIFLGQISGKQILSAYTNDKGYELYSYSPGSGLSLIKDINITPRQQSQTEAITFNNGGSTYTVFGASDAQYGAEPRVSVNGAPPTSAPLKDILAGGFGSDPRGFTVGGTGLSRFGYFTADDGKGRQLWRTSGTAAGTVKVTLPNGLGAGFTADSQITVTPTGTPYFVGYSSTGTHILSVSGGAATLADTRPVGSLVTELTAIPGGALFTGIQDTTNPDNYEPRWINGNSASVQLSDVNPGPDGSFPYEYIQCGAIKYFAADDGANGYELFRLDGYTSTLVKNVNSGASGSNLTKLTCGGDDQLYWVAYGDVYATPGQVDGIGSPRLAVWRTNPDGKAYSDVQLEGEGGGLSSVNSPLFWSRSARPTYLDYSQNTVVSTPSGKVAFFVSSESGPGQYSVAASCYPSGTTTRFIYAVPPASNTADRDSAVTAINTLSGNPPPAFVTLGGGDARKTGFPLSFKTILWSEQTGNCFDYIPGQDFLDPIDRYDPKLFANEVKLAALGNYLYIAKQYGGAVNVVKYDATQALQNFQRDAIGLVQYSAVSDSLLTLPGMTIDQVTLTPTGNKMFLNYVEGGNFKMNDVTN